MGTNPPNTDELSIGRLLADATARLRAAGVDSPRREARLLLAHVLGVSQEDIVAERLPLIVET